MINCKHKYEYQHYRDNVPKICKFCKKTHVEVSFYKEELEKVKSIPKIRGFSNAELAKLVNTR